MPRVPSLFHQHHAVLFIFMNSKKMMWNHTKSVTLSPIIIRVRFLCENIILYRYQVNLIVLH
jgi:hypothetical protein